MFQIYRELENYKFLYVLLSRVLNLTNHCNLLLSTIITLGSFQYRNYMGL